MAVYGNHIYMMEAAPFKWHIKDLKEITVFYN